MSKHVPRFADSYRSARKAAARVLAKGTTVKSAPSRQVAREFRAVEAMREISRAAAQGENAR